MYVRDQDVLVSVVSKPLVFILHAFSYVLHCHWLRRTFKQHYSFNYMYILRIW